MSKPIDIPMKNSLIKFNANSKLIKELQAENEKIRELFVNEYSHIDPSSDYKGTVKIEVDPTLEVKLEYKLNESVPYEKAKEVLELNGWKESELFKVKYELQVGKTKNYTKEQKIAIGEITKVTKGKTTLEVIQKGEN